MSETLLKMGDALPNLPFVSTATPTDSFEHYQNKHLVLYFYPKDNTPGCTSESVAFRDRYPEFQTLNTEILGISRDTLASHEKFRAKYALPFHLISDTDSAWCELFNVLRNKLFFGKTLFGISRSTFLISPTGNLLHEWRGVKVKTHIPDVLNFLKQLN